MMLRPHQLRVLFLSLLILVLACGSALAGVDVPTPDANAPEWLKALYAAATSGEWKIFAGLVLVGIVYPLRLYGPRVLKTAFGGLVLAFAIALAGTFGLALATGAKMTLGLIVASLSTAATAAGVWEWIKAHIPGGAAASDKIKAGA